MKNFQNDYDRWMWQEEGATNCPWAVSKVTELRHHERTADGAALLKAARETQRRDAWTGLRRPFKLLQNSVYKANIRLCYDCECLYHYYKYYNFLQS